VLNISEIFFHGMKNYNPLQGLRISHSVYF